VRRDRKAMRKMREHATCLCTSGAQLEQRVLPLLGSDPPNWNPPDRGEEQPPPVHSVRGEKTMKIMRTVLAVLAVASAAGCNDAQIASTNLSRAADNFEILRRVVFLNGITDTYLLSIEGLCAIEDQSNQLEVTCKVGENNEFKKHFLGLSDNVTYFAEQIDGAQVSAYHYRVVFKPQAIIPDIDIRGSAQELLENASENANP